MGFFLDAFLTDASMSEATFEQMDCRCVNKECFKVRIFLDTCFTKHSTSSTTRWISALVVYGLIT